MWYDYLFPKAVKCMICGVECNSVAICTECYSKLPFIHNHCSRCGGEVYGELDLCDDCVGNPHLYDECYCVLEYRGVVREKILNLKNNHASHLAKPFADILLAVYEERDYHPDIIIPMPIHENRLKQRGYNQSELLCDSMAEATGLVDTNILVRVIDTPHQTGLNRENRKKNIHSAFKVMDKEKVKGKIILLVDDIYTTGSTIDECVRMLKKAGAAQVSVLCLSRTPIIKTGLEEEF